MTNLFLVMILLLSMLANILLKTSNIEIRSGRKFKVYDEVYSCKLEQKLEYGK